MLSTRNEANLCPPPLVNHLDYACRSYSRVRYFNTIHLSSVQEGTAPHNHNGQTELGRGQGKLEGRLQDCTRDHCKHVRDAAYQVVGELEDGRDGEACGGVGDNERECAFIKPGEDGAGCIHRGGDRGSVEGYVQGCVEGHVQGRIKRRIGRVV